MSLINGIGGAFIFSDDPEQLARWYTEKFGLVFEGGGEAFYQVFLAVDPGDSSHRLDTLFSIIKANTSFSRPAPAEEPESMYGDQPFMLNLRTDDLAALIAHLEETGVRVIKQQDEPYGKFAWIRDPEGNRIELYQPLGGSN